MSEESTKFVVPVTKILDVTKHPNAHSLDIVKCFDYNVVTRRDQYKKNDSVIYIPIDSILPMPLEEQIFPIGSKIKLNKSRVKQIRIRNFASQGMILNIDDVKSYFKELPTIGDNVAGILGITKFEPEEQFFGANQPKTKKERNKPWENAYFHQYGGLNNFKFYAQTDLFTKGQEVIYQEKIHGTNGRAAMLPFKPKNLWQRILRMFGKLADYQFCYGSNSVQLQDKAFTGYYPQNVYAEACQKYELAQKLEPNESVYFEIYGSGIQKGYTYGHKDGERSIVVFDVKVLSNDKKSTRWLSVDELTDWCRKNKLPMVPILYRGPHSNEIAQDCTKGDSVIAGQKIREGIVVRDPNETVCYYGKKSFKLLSEEYLDGDNSDHH